MLPPDKDKLTVAIKAAAKLWEEDNASAYRRAINEFRRRETDVVSVICEMLVVGKKHRHIDQVLVDVISAQSVDVIDRYVRLEGERTHHGIVGAAVQIMQPERAAAAVLEAIRARRLPPLVGPIMAVIEALMRTSPERCEEFCLAVLEFRGDDKAFLGSISAFVLSPTRRVVEAVVERLPLAMGEPPLSNSVYEAWCSPAATAGCVALAGGVEWRGVERLLASDAEALRVVAETMIVHDLGIRSPWLSGYLQRRLLPIANRPQRDECLKVISGTRVGQRVFKQAGLNPDGTPKGR